MHCHRFGPSKNASIRSQTFSQTPSSSCRRAMTPTLVKRFVCLDMRKFATGIAVKALQLLHFTTDCWLCKVDFAGRNYKDFPSLEHAALWSVERGSWLLVCGGRDTRIGHLYASVDGVLFAPPFTYKDIICACSQNTAPIHVL